MKIKTWHERMSNEEAAELAYWERNMLALHFADGWYNDDVDLILNDDGSAKETAARYKGWRRVLSLDGGKITFHIHDDFEVGNLPEIQRNWDGHTTQEKWARIAISKGIKVEE